MYLNVKFDINAMSFHMNFRRKRRSCKAKDGCCGEENI
jgi:hypothetical protein